MQSGDPQPPRSAEASPLVLRARAAEATRERFDGQPFAWGSTDCLRMAAFHLRALGVSPPLRAAGRYGSHLGARRALKRTGHATLQDWVSSWGLRPIAPAMAMTGDLVALPSGDDAMPALAVALSNGRLLGFVPEARGCCVFTLLPGAAPLGAWAP